MLSLGFAPGFLARAAAATGTRARLLIAVFQRGAVDGLNMVVPYGESEYYRLRPTIAIAGPGEAHGALDLNGFFGLHPRLAPLLPDWKDGALAIVHACGSPDSTRSHFDAQDYMETATPGVKSTRDGWLNRYLQRAGSRTPLQGVAIGKSTPRAMQGSAATLSLANVDAFDVRGGDRAAMEARYATADPRLAGSAREAFEAMRTLREATGGPYRPAAGVEYPRSAFGQALQEIARVAKADVGLEVAFAESTNWDHHVNEGGAEGQVAGRLDDFARGIAALARDLGDRMADTVILTMSEFGRTVAQNGTGGTDHGHGNAMLLLGGPVKGGTVYGPWPGLDGAGRHDGRDLAVTTDFRAVFSEVITGHLGLAARDLPAIFPGFATPVPLGLLRA